MNPDDGDSSGHRPVRQSRAGPGVVAEPPTDGGAITEIEVTDHNDDPSGLLIEWKDDDLHQWMWAAVGAYEAISQ